MDYDSILDLIEKAKEIVGEKEYEEICSEYKKDTIDKTSLKRHARNVGVAKRLFTKAMAKNPDEIDLKFIATYFLMCVDMVKHNLDIDRYESDKNILKLIKTYC